MYTLTRSFQNLIFDLFEPFRGGLFCFASLSCCIIQMQLSFRTQMDGQAFFFRIFYLRAEFLIIPSVTASCPSPEGAEHHTTTILFDCWYDVCLFFYGQGGNCFFKYGQVVLDSFFPFSEIIFKKCVLHLSNGIVIQC